MRKRNRPALSNVITTNLSCDKVVCEGTKLSTAKSLTKVICSLQLSASKRVQRRMSLY